MQPLFELIDDDHNLLALSTSQPSQRVGQSGFL